MKPRICEKCDHPIVRGVGVCDDCGWENDLKYFVPLTKVPIKHESDEEARVRERTIWLRHHVPLYLGTGLTIFLSIGLWFISPVGAEITLFIAGFTMFTIGWAWVKWSGLFYRQSGIIIGGTCVALLFGAIVFAFYGFGAAMIFRLRIYHIVTFAQTPDWDECVLMGLSAAMGVSSIFVVCYALAEEGDYETPLNLLGCGVWLLALVAFSAYATPEEYGIGDAMQQGLDAVLNALGIDAKRYY